MKSQSLKIVLPLLLSSILLTGSALAQNMDYNFHWSPSAVIDGDGIVRPEAVAYEVYVQRGSDSQQLVATVTDTLFTLSAEPGIAQRLAVRAVDSEGRFSPMSQASDPIYFEAEEEDNRGGTPEMPPVAELRANYPNPFNPETRVRYGVPESASDSDPMRLAIYNVKGQLVRNLEVDRTPGWHEVTWDGRDERGVVASTGLYLTRFMVGSMVTTGKMTMVK